MNIITSYDGRGPYKEMAGIARKCAERFGYSFTIKEVYLDEYVPQNNMVVKHSKAGLLKEKLTDQGIVWMDADSMVVNRIDDLLDVDCDMAMCVKEPECKSKRFGSYLYSGFVLVNDTEAARRFLDAWDSCDKTGRSDQRNLNTLLKDHLDDSIYTKAGEVVDLGELRVHLLDPNVYCNRQSINDMTYPSSDIRVVHFKGAVWRKWDEYKELLC